MVSGSSLWQRQSSLSEQGPSSLRGGCVLGVCTKASPGSSCPCCGHTACLGFRTLWVEFVALLAASCCPCLYVTQR